jgi:acetyl esterase/lipase
MPWHNSNTKMTLEFFLSPIFALGSTRFLKMAHVSTQTQVFRYGVHESQYMRLSLPLTQSPKTSTGDAESAKLPVALIVHGGFWKQKWTAENTCITSIVVDLVANGFAALEIEYRRREDDGGGWPGSNEDVLAALNFVPKLTEMHGFPLDHTSVTLIGHSAGGTMVLWVAAHADKVLPELVVAVAPITDLAAGFRQRYSNPAVHALAHSKSRHHTTAIATP